MLSVINFDRRKIVLFVIVIFLFVAIIEIWAVNRLSTYGEKLSMIEQQKQELTLENQTLGDEIATRSSLAEIEKYATAFGFVDTTKVSYLPNEGLALNR